MNKHKDKNLEKDKTKEEFSSKDDLKSKKLNGEGEMSLSVDEIKSLKRKAAESESLSDKYLRVCADFDNARKRWDKERMSLIKFASYNIIRNLIVILDELGHALEAIKEHSTLEEITRGVEITYKNLLSLLKKENLMIIEAKGNKFDPHIHEIVGQKEVEPEDEHIVLEEVQKGYMLDDKVLRTSKVIVGVVKESEDGGDEGKKDNNGDEEEV